MKPDPHPCDGCQKVVVYGDYRPCLCPDCRDKEAKKKEGADVPIVVTAARYMSAAALECGASEEAMP